MILLITGASHTGKTVLAQKLMQKYGYPYLSIDLLKMGLIRSGQTALGPESPDAALTDYLWPIVREMIKTAIENDQKMIVEGCYIPFEWHKDFTEDYLRQIHYLCLVMASAYIHKNWESICAHANDIECRQAGSWLSPEKMEHENREYLQGCIEYGLNYVLITDECSKNLEFDAFSV